MFRKLFWLVISKAVIFHLLSVISLPVEAGEEKSERLSSQILEEFEGLPLFRNISYREHGGGVQNWSTVQDKRGVIYVGNNDGVLEFNGARWRLIEVANKTVVRSLSVDSGGRVYVGAKGEIGYLQSDETGRTEFVSLMSLLPEEQRSFSDVWKTIATDRGIFFQSREQLMLYAHNRFRVWKSRQGFHFAFYINGRLLIREVGSGLLELSDDQLRLIPESELFAQERVCFILPFIRGECAQFSDNQPEKNEKLLIGTRTKGIYFFDGKQFQPFPTEVDQILREGLLSCGEWLADGTLALGTIQVGLIRIDACGKLRSFFNRNFGLLSNTIYHLLVNDQNELWLATDKGVALVEMPAPLSMFDSRLGLEGSVINIIRHQDDLYVATTIGVYYLTVKEDGKKEKQKLIFLPVKGISAQCWSFARFDKKLLLANYKGVFEIEGVDSRLVVPTPLPALALHRSRLNPARVFVGLYDGLTSILFDEKSGSWINEGKFPEIKEEIRTIVELQNGQLWLGTDSEGLLRLVLRYPPSGLTKKPEIGSVERFGPEQGLPLWIRNAVYAGVDRQPLLATAEGIFRFDEQEKRFYPDQRFVRLFNGEKRWTAWLCVDKANRIWMDTSGDNPRVHEIGVAIPLKDGKYYWESTPFLRISELVFWSIYAEDDVVWFGGPDGLIRYDRRVFRKYVQNYPVMFSTVKVIGGRALPILTVKQMSLNQVKLELNFSENRLRFDFALPSFVKTDFNAYQTYLEGFEKDWSEWNGENFKEYTNLPAGSYRFRVRGKNVFGQISDEACYSFTVLPPWYQCWWAYLLFSGGGMGIIALIFQWKHRKLINERKRLQQLVDEKTRELRELSLSDPLTGLRNRRFLIEVIEPEIRSFSAFKKHLLLKSDRRLTREEQKIYGFYLLDLDHFKQVNDLYGHEAGDEVLKQFSLLLKESIREDDYCLRWGGEEFLVILRRTSEAYIDGYVRKIRSQLASLRFLGPFYPASCLRMTCSIGYLSFPVFSKSPDFVRLEDIIALADFALYQAKRGGRDRAVRISANQSEILPEEFRKILETIESAVNQGFFKLKTIID